MGSCGRARLLIVLAASAVLTACAPAVPDPGASVLPSVPVGCPGGVAELPDEVPTAPSTVGHLVYEPVEADITEPVTKFGGQPVWLGDPQWPVGATSGQPMTFIGQIALGEPWFPEREGLAYLFMSEFLNGDEATWDPYAGDNAIIIQPGGTALVPVTDRATGPTVVTWTPDGKRETVYRVDVEPAEEPAYLRQDDRMALTDDQYLAYATAVYPDKLGGAPDFFQGSEFPECGAMNRLLLQIGLAPFDLNLGDGGVGWAFVDLESGTGRFLFQSH